MALREYIPGADYGRYMGEEISEAKRVGGVPAAVGRTIGLAPGAVLAAGSDIAGAAEPIIRPWAQALKTAVTGDPTLIGQEPRQARVTPAVTTGTPKQPSTTTPSTIPSASRGRATPARTIARVVESTRIWGPEQQGIQTGVDPRLSQQLYEARQEAAARGDWDAVNASYGPGGLRGDYQQPGAGSRMEVIGGASTPWGALLSAGIKGKQTRLAEEEAGRTERAALGEEGATRRAQMQEAGQESRFGRTSALEREKFTREQDDPRRAEQARLFGFQADTAQGQLDWQRKLDLAKQRIAIETDPKKKAGLIADFKFLSGAKEENPYELKLKEFAAGAQLNPETGQYEDRPVQKLATGGVVERYNGEDGSLVRPRYFDTGATWDKLAAGAKGALGMSAKEPAPAPKQAIATAPEPDPSKGMWELTPEEEAAALGRPAPAPVERYNGKFGSLVQPGNGLTPDMDWYTSYARQAGDLALPFEQAIAIKRGSNVQQPVARFADGGDVSALNRPIRGPGTGTSDSIPAVVNGERPAALSDGEFVIPAHVVKAKGTEFFEKLIAQYADKGEENVV